MTDNLQKLMLVIVQLLLPGCPSFQLPSKHSLVLEYLSIPFLICRTSPLIHELPLLQLVMPSLECLTLALYSPSLASSSLSSHTLERSEFCAASLRSYVTNCWGMKLIFCATAYAYVQMWAQPVVIEVVRNYMETALQRA